jgi:hypothetical protein
LRTLQSSQLGTQFLDARAVQIDALLVQFDHVVAACEPIKDRLDMGREIETSLDVTVALDGILLM